MPIKRSPLVVAGILLVLTSCSSTAAAPAGGTEAGAPASPGVATGTSANSPSGAPADLSERIATFLADCAEAADKCAGRPLPSGTGQGEKNIAEEATAICGWLTPAMSTYMGTPEQYAPQGGTYWASKADAADCVFDETAASTVHVAFAPPGAEHDLGCYGGAVCRSLDVGQEATEDRTGSVRMLTDSGWFVTVGGRGRPTRETTLPVLQEINDALK